MWVISTLVLILCIAYVESFRLSPFRSLRLNAEATTGGESTWVGAKQLSAKDNVLKPVLTNEQIAKILPHRYPFLLVDRVVEFEPGKRAVGIKAITANEPQVRS